MKKWNFGWLIFFLCVASSAQAQSVSSLIAKSRKETDPAVKVRLLTQAVEKSPRTAAAWHHRADAYRESQQLPAALKDYTQAIQLTPKDPFRYYARALAYMEGKQYTLAAADLTKAIALKKEYLDFYLYRAQAHMALGKYADAIADYKKYLAKNKKTPHIALALAEAYIKIYNYPPAEEELNFVQQLQPDWPESYLWRGRLLHNQGDLDEAVSYYSKAINRDDTLVLAYRYRANAFKEMGELETSAQDYTRLIELTPDVLFYNRRGLVYEELGWLDKALQDYSKAIEMAPRWPIAHNNRGYIYLKQKKYAQARADFESALKLDGTLPTPYINLAGLAWLQKKDRRATYRYLDKALKRNFRDFESLYDPDKKGWMFSGINNTSEFRSVMYK